MCTITPPLLSTIFTPAEVTRISAEVTSAQPALAAYCSFENRFAKSGGLGAVTQAILPFLAAHPQVEKALLLSPYYPEFMKQAPVKPVKQFEFVFFHARRRITLYQYDPSPDQSKPPRPDEYYIQADGFFNSGLHIADPYIYNDYHPQLNRERLQQNMLFFCAVLPAVLNALGYTANSVVLLQDWHAAAAAWTIKHALLTGLLSRVSVIHTLHNPFDEFLTWRQWQQILPEFRIAALKNAGFTDGCTALSLGLGLTDAPITTVSPTFAFELQHDSMNTDYFAPQLQNIFTAVGIRGIKNGAFIPPLPDLQAVHSLSDMQQFKRRARMELIKFSTEFQDPRCIGHLDWSRPDPAAADPPILVMTGRLDHTQKGYDLTLGAILNLPPGFAKWIVCPLPIQKGDLDIFRFVCAERPGDVLVLPFRLSTGFSTLLTGATFGLMPSLYEPFGAAVEYFSHGTPVIARATGGLCDQIQNQHNGILFRESPLHYTLPEIGEYMALANKTRTRWAHAWAQDMITALIGAIKFGTQVTTATPDLYADWCFNAIQTLPQFNWTETVSQLLDFRSH